MIDLTVDSRCDALVVGAGFGGIATLHKLRECGLQSRLIESAAGPGGVWFWNRYPGARCDVESFDYSFSFDPDLEQEWHWTEKFAPQPEILGYINHVVDRFDLRKDMTFETKVMCAVYDEGSCTWIVTTDTGERIICNYLVMATGTLSVTKYPQLPGLEEFQGDSYHTGSWPHNPVDFTGKRVGIIGVGSSGTQMVGPVSSQAEQLFIFQRTPNFCIPAPNTPMDPVYEAQEKARYRERRAFTRETASGLNRDMNRVPALSISEEERRAHYEEAWKSAGFGFILSFNDLLLSNDANQTAVKFINDKVREIVKDPEVAALLTATDYPFGAKRPSIDSHYHEAFNKKHVTLVDIRSAPIECITRAGIKTTEKEYELDAIVFATGYDAMTGALSRIDIIGKDGVLLSEKWAGGPRTYLGISSHGFPNLFIVAGPGSPSVLSNVMVSIEQHVEWISDLLVYARDEGIVEIEAALDKENDWVEHVNELAAGTLYPDANSWYLGADVPGKPRVFMPYPGGLRAYRRKCNEVVASGYEGFELRSTIAVGQ